MSVSREKVRIKGLSFDQRFDVTGEAFYPYAAAKDEGNVLDVWALAKDAARRGCIVIYGGGSDGNLEAIKAFSQAKGMVGEYSANEHAGVMSREAGIPFMGGTQWVEVHLEGKVRDEAPGPDRRDRSEQRRLALIEKKRALHGKQVRLYTVGKYAYVEEV